MKKLLSSFFLFAISYLLFAIAPSPALAQPNQDPNAVPPSKSWIAPSPKEVIKEWKDCDNITNPKLSSTCFRGYQWAGFLSDLAITTLNADPKTGPSGAIYSTGLLIASLYERPPVRTAEYLADISSNLGINIIPKTYAETVGQQALGPVLPIWKQIRNITYGLFVIIFLIIGFTIMFRRKIDPQTVVNIQNSIPRIVVSLILVTFSYAIAGLIVDLMILLTRATLFFFQPLISNFNTAYVDSVTNDNIFNLVNPIRNSQILRSQVFEKLQFPIFEGIADNAFKMVGWVTVLVVFGVAGFFIMFKIFFMLLLAYIGIILNTIFAPLRLMFGALPGKNEARDWLRDLISHMIVFPITFSLLLFAAFMQAASGNTEVTKPPWQVDSRALQQIDWAPPLIGSKWGEAIGPLLAFGVLFTIPSITKMVQQALEIKPSPAEGAAYEEIRGKVTWVPFLGSFLQRVT